MKDKRNYNTFPLLNVTGSEWPDRIVSAVITHANIKRHRLFLINNTSHEVHRFRAIAMWLMDRLTHLKRSEIAIIFRCDRTTVCSAIRGVKIKSKTHDETNNHIKSIEELLIPLP